MQSTFGFSGETVGSSSGTIKKVETLREMQEDIQDLKEEKQRLEFKWNTFRIGNETLGDLIKENISEQEKKTLESIIIAYGEDTQKLENKIYGYIEKGKEIDEKKKQLLLLKQNFYKSLIPYIEKEKLQNFLKYINSDLNYREKSKDVTLEIEQKNVQREERLEEIQDKIEDNSKVLREQIKQRITLKIENRLDIFIAQEKFNSLENTAKIEIFQRLISKLQEKRESLENTINSTSVLEEKIILFEAIEEILQDYLERWQ